MTIHVVGNVCLDITHYVPRFPRPGETLMADRTVSGLGGKGVNQAVAAARAGADVVLHAAIGRGQAQPVRARLAAEPGLEFRLTEFDLETDTSTLLVTPDGENAIVSATPCARAFRPDLDPEVWDGLGPEDMVLLQGNLEAGTTAACLRLGRARSALTIVNPSPLWAVDPLSAAMADVVVANASEIETLTGQDPTSGAAVLLHRLGQAPATSRARAVVVTLGGRGAVMLDRDGQTLAAAPPTAACDTSGAGDVFCGIFVGLLSRGMPPAAALARAVAAASLSVTREGALASCPSADEIRALTPIQARRSP